MRRVLLFGKGKKAAGGPLYITIASVVALTLLEAIPAGGSGGPGSGVVTTFSTGSAEATIYFPQYQEEALACITLPRSAHILSASLWIRGLPGRGGEYPSRPTLDLGADGNVEWAYSEEGIGGEMGRQVEFIDGKAEAVCAFPSETGTTGRVSILLPRGARITSASMELLGEERWVRSWEYDFEVPPPRLLGWSQRRGGFIVLTGDTPEMAISLVEPSTGSVSPVGKVRFNDSGPIEAHYDSLSDMVAFFRPKEGVLLYNLTTGASREVFTGQTALELTIISLRGGWLVGAGPGWVAAANTLTGEIVEPTGLSQSMPGFPAALDYDPSTRTAFVASTLQRGWWAVSLVQLDRGDVRSHSYQSSNSDQPLSVVLLPGTNRLLVAMSSSYSGPTQPAAPVLEIDSLSWAQSEFSPFRDTGASLGLVLEGGRVAGLSPSSSGIAVTEFDLAEESWIRHLIALPEGDKPTSWAMDGGGGKMLIYGESTGLWLFELRAGKASRVFLNESWAGAARRLECLVPLNDSLILGTPQGLVAINRTTGEPKWLLDCGSVKVMQLVSGRLAVGSMDGWKFDKDYGHWRFFKLRVTLLELGAAGAPLSSRSYFMELLPEYWDCRPTAVALDPFKERVFIGVAGEHTASGLFELELVKGEFTGIETPTPFLSSLLLNPASGTLFAGCRREGGGLYAINLSSGRTHLYSPASVPALLNTEVTSMCLDERGRLIIGHGAYSPGSGECIGGLTVFSPGMGSATYVHAGEGFPLSNLDVVAVVRDCSAGRTFLALGYSGRIIALDASFRPEPFSEPAYFGSSYITGGRNLIWEETTRTLFGAAKGVGIAYRWTGDYPEGVTVDVGGDGEPEWSSAGPLGRVILTGLENAFQARLDSVGGGDDAVEVELVLRSSPGIVRLRELSIIYEFAVRVELTEALRSLLATQPLRGDFCAPVRLGAKGGGLLLFNLSIHYQTNNAPEFRRHPELKVDAASPSPTFLNLTPLFKDDHTPASNLTYELLTPSPATGVRVSVVFSNYLMIEAHNTPFRGRMKVVVEARDSSGLLTTGELWVVVVRSGEYIPPPPAYGVFVWAAAAVLLVIGVWAILLFWKIQRRRD
ncbi:MAG: hypothetical protein QXH42_02025 [Thermoplasmata archaeon]